MKIGKGFKKSLSYMSIIGLVMSNMTFVHAEENKLPNRVAETELKPDPGILVSNVSNGSLQRPSLTQEEIDALKEKGQKSIEAAVARDRKNKLTNKANLSNIEVQNPDEKVSVIVQLKGQTVSEMIEDENVGVQQMSLSKASSMIQEDIQTTKNLIISTLIVGKSKSGNNLQFKHEYENVFKGFSIDNIKYSDIDVIKSLPDVKAVTIQQLFYPAVNQQHDLTGIKELWSGAAVGKPSGYQGEGMVIAILDTGVDYTHEAFPDPKDMSKARIKKGKFIRPDGTTSLKVVDGYNWADQNDDVIPRVEDPNNATSSHGVHVAGIAAGSGPVIQGVAPEAQIIAEKVFSDHQAGALTEDIIKGIDHASALGADVINMSLGSSSSFDTRDPNDPLGIAIRNATDEGHVVVVAAGNASNAYADRNGGMGETIKIGQTPDLNKIGNPGVYPDSFTVAAANNLVSKHTYKFYTDDVGYNISGEGLDDWNWTADKEKEYSLVSLGKDFSGNDRLGVLSDYDGLDVTGKIVLIKRGTISFAEKVANAKQKGAVGVIVYNSDPDKPAPDPQGFGTIPFSFISYEDGMALQAVFDELSCGGGGGIGIGPLTCGGGGIGIGPLDETTNPVSINFKIRDEKLSSAFSESNPGQPTDFTSWGTTSDLLLKPEVMAPGHAIVSSVRTGDASKHNAYESEDGTSMAAPYVAGAIADVMQALKEKGFNPGTRAFAQLTKNLIMNTSIPAKRDYVNESNSIDRSDYMTEYQPRRQGAGMIRPDLAVKSPIVVTGTNGTGSISLKEIDKDTTFTLIASNHSNQAATYKLEGTVMTDVLKDSLKTNSDNIRSRYLDDAKLSFDLKEIAIPANSTKRVTITLSLADSTLKNTFVEGYIYLTPTDSSLPTLNVPYNGFYGDWDEPKIIDTPETTDVWTQSGFGTQLAIKTGPFYFGYEELFGKPQTPAQIALGDKYYAFGPYFSPVPALALLRNARNLNIDVVDKEHNFVTHISDDEWQIKTDPYSFGLPAQVSADWVWYAYNQAVPVPDGQYYFAITATADAPNAKPQPTVYIPMYKDTTAPTLNLLRSADYDEKTNPEVTNTDSYTVRWTLNDGDAGGVDGNVFLAVNGSEPFTTYQEDVKQNADGTYELNVPGLNEGLNIITIAPIDKVGNFGESRTVIVNKTSNHVWIDLSSATLGDNVPSMYWNANVKPGDQFSLNFNAVGRTGVVKKIQAVLLKDYYDNNTIIGNPVDLDLNQLMTEKLAYGEYSEYSIKGQYTVPTDLPAGEYVVKFVILADGEQWNDPEVPAIGIETFVDTVAPTISLNPNNMKAYVENSGDPVSLMVNTTVKDEIANSRGYKVEVAVDGGSQKSMGSVTTADRSAQTFRYPVVLANGDHSIVLTTTDYMGNASSMTFEVTIAADKVTIKNDGTNTELPINVVPYKDASRNAEIKLSYNKTYHVENFDPWVGGYLVTPYGNNKTWSANPDLAPILLVGNQQRKATTNYYPIAIPDYNLPLDDVYFFNGPVGYTDPGSIPQGESTFPVTMIDYLGHETTIQVPVIKNSYIPKVKFDNAIIDQSTGTATFFTYDSTYTVNGTVTAVRNNFYAEWVDWNRRVAGEDNFYKNLFDPTSEWRSNVYDNPFNEHNGDIPEGYNYEPGVKPFSMPTGELKPGANFFEIDGGSTIGENPSHPFAGNHPLVFNVVVYRLGAAEAADQPLATNAANNLTWDMIKGDNNVDQTNVITNLALPNVDKNNNAEISWNSSDPTVITNDGKVYRSDSETDITLTATATVGGATAVKTFNVTVKAKNQDDSLAVAEDSSFISWNVIRSGNNDQGDVSQALSLPTRGSNGSIITWTSDDTKHITNQGRVYIPLFDEADAHVELVAKITRNSKTIYKTFNLTVLKDSVNADKTKVLRVYQTLDTKKLLGENTSDMDVTKDLSFPTSFGNDGVSIFWESDNPEIIANDGKVTRPEQNQYIGVFGYFKLGNARLGKQYYFFVRGKDTSDEPAVQAATSSIVWNLIKKNNVEQKEVKYDLNLPTKGNNDTTITWSSSHPSVIKNDGTVIRPSYEQGNREVTLTATISKGTASETKSFILNVIRNEEVVPPVLPPVVPAPPVAPKINPIDDNDLVITGSAAAESTIIVKNNEGVIATGKANSTGVFNITISLQKAGTLLNVYAKNADGIQSEAATTVVLDRTAPSAPKINTIDDNDLVLTGLAEANATVIVKNNEQVIGTGTANSTGGYYLNVGSQKARTVLTVYAKDADGNLSTAATIVVLDRTAPNAPKINAVDDNDTAVVGTAEVNSTVIVKNKDKVIATGTANSKGAFKIQISRQKSGTVLTVYAKDAAGNQSKASTTVVLDRTAPNAPKITSFFANGKNEIKGTAEANTTIIVTKGNKVVAKVKVTSKGTFVLILPKPGKGKSEFVLSAIDKAGNKSESVKRSIIIK